MAELGIKTRQYIEFDSALVGRKVELGVYRPGARGGYVKTQERYVGIVTSVSPTNFVFCYRESVDYELNFKTITVDSLYHPANLEKGQPQLYELQVRETVL